MSFEKPLLVQSLESAVDLTNVGQYRAVKDDGTGKMVLAGAGELVIGVCQNNPGTGQTGTYMSEGVSKMVCAGSIAIGAKVASDASGNATVAGSGDHPIGIALEASGGSGEIIAVKLDITLTPLA